MVELLGELLLEKMMLKSIRKAAHYRKQYAIWQRKYDALAPKQGDLATDFELKDVTGEHSVRLSGFRGRQPVALIFSSFT